MHSRRNRLLCVSRPLLGLWQTPSSPLALPQRPPAPERVDVMVSRGCWVIGLLSLVSGHFDIPTEAKDKQKRTIEEVTTELNAGIAITTPAENIKELLMRPDVIEERKEQTKDMEKPVATTDFNSVQRQTQRTLAKEEKDR